MTDEIEDAVVDAILTHDGPSGPASESYLRAVTAVARAVLAVPAVAAAFRDAERLRNLAARYDDDGERKFYGHEIAAMLRGDADA